MLNHAEMVKKAIRGKDYVVFGDNRGYDLNIFGVRTKDVSANTFNDHLGVMYLQHGVWNFFVFPGTTDPGLYWRENPMNVNGTAMLKPGQYRGCWKLGQHKGYDALQQAKDVTVYRDADRDQYNDPDEDDIQVGMFGINIHRASSHQQSSQVDKWSAGCQVFADPLHFDFFMSLVKKSASIYGEFFTYTLLTEDDF